MVSKKQKNTADPETKLFFETVVALSATKAARYEYSWYLGRLHRSVFNASLSHSMEMLTWKELEAEERIIIDHGYGDRLTLTPGRLTSVLFQAATSGILQKILGHQEHYADPLNYLKRSTEYSFSAEEILRRTAVEVFTRNFDAVPHFEAEWSRSTRKHEPLALLVLGNPFDATIIDSLGPGAAEWILNALPDAVLWGYNVPDVVLPHLHNLQKTNTLPPTLWIIEAYQYLISGDFQALSRECTNHPKEPLAAEIPAWIAAARGEPHAVSLFENALEQLKKPRQKKAPTLSPIGDCLYAFALIRTGKTSHLAIANQLLEATLKRLRVRVLAVQDIHRLVQRLLGGSVSAPPPFERDPWSRPTVDFAKVMELLSTMLDAEDLSTTWVSTVDAALNDTHPVQSRWLYAQLLRLKARFFPNDTKLNKQVETLGNYMGIVTWLADVVPRRAAWEKKLDALVTFIETTAPTKSPDQTSRIAWVLSHGFAGWELVAREQKLGQNRQWSRGAILYLKRLSGASGAHLDFATEIDRKVMALIRVTTSAWSGEPKLTLDVDEALAALVGHPAVFLSDPETEPVEVVQGEVAVNVERLENGFKLHMFPKVTGNKRIWFVLQDRRIIVYHHDPRKQRLAELLGDGLVFPATAEPRLKEMLPMFAELAPVHSTLLAPDANAIAGDPRPRALLTPRGPILRLEIRVRPLGDDTPTFLPGEGAQTVLIDVAGQRKITNRDLAGELALAMAVVRGCPTLGDESPQELSWTWDLLGPLEALELLGELGKLGDGILYEWASGKKMAAPMEVTSRALSINVAKHNDFFRAEAQVELDDGTVLEFARLIDLYRQKGEGRFVVIDDQRVLALSEDLRRTLEDLETFVDKQGGKLSFAPVRALALQPILEAGGNFQADKHWKAWLKMLQESENLTPIVPAEFREVLRPYQVDGFRWLARLAHAQLGACLADDMGLGKTVQVLALCVHRASRGPALVAAPTSVCLNWVAEIRKFAPSLRPTVFGVGNRAQTLADAQPHDVIIVSYGLLQSESELFAGRSFATIILDEAQWIKNTTTKRSQAAMGLTGEFRVITTGTPVENHLGELWNLFQFINPGLLGSLERFNERFALPIERNDDRGARKKLKTLVSPFLLRRTKGQVLDELPSRTDITITVEASPEERAFYEALRQKAIEGLAGQAERPIGQKHMMVLAELMRLRRACCHPRLVVPDVPLGSSKLQTFLEIVDELLENAHRALVFSQFVDHLTVAREALDKKGITYQYLDGSTKAADRQKRVQAFQNGEGSLFLLSLKAGGVGLNLTGADYVIHLDPWWNPAVEDQASDRAHRLGQTRPVTIYRLVMQHTVESRIVDLHRHKRDLATSLLEGTDTAKKISYDELLALLKE